MIKIQGKSPTTVELCNYTLTRKEEGNSGYMVIWDDDEFQPYDLVEITQDATYQFLVDKIKPLTLGEDLSKQEVFLQDTIHIFDKITPPSRRFSKNKMASEFLDVFRFDEKEKPYFEYTSMYLLDLIMPQKEYDGENLTSIIKDIARRINCKAHVTIRDGQVPLLTFVPMTQRVGAEAIDYTPQHFQYEIASSNYATEILGKVKNAIVEDGRGTWFPSKNYGIAPRTDNFRFDEATAGYILNDKIWAVLKVVIPNAIEIYDGTSTYEVDLDVTNWVVSKPEWDYLENPTAANTQSATIIDQSNTVYYQIGGDRIEQLWSNHPDLTAEREHLANLYQSAIGKYAVDNPTHTITIPAKYENTTFSIPFIIKYVSQRDIDYIVEKMDIVNKYSATLLSNQLSSLVELNQHANAMSILAERVGNKEITFKETTSGTLYKLGNWTSDNRVITTVTREIDGDDTHQTVEVSKNFANINVETSVSRTPEKFQITDKQIITNFKTKEYIEFSEELKAIDSYMNATAQRIAVNIFDYSATYDTPIFDGQIIPNINEFIVGSYTGKAIHTPLMTFSGNTIGFHSHFVHKTFAGYTLLDNKRGVIPYKEESVSGEIEDLVYYDIQLGTENVIDDSGTDKLYPLVTETTGLIDIGLIFANLDPDCLLAHTHNIATVTDSPEKIILNGNFGFYNNLIKELDNPSLKVYVSQEIYQPFTVADKKVRTNDVEYESGIINFNHTTRLLSVTHPNTTDNIAIVLGDDIILALNGIDSCYINFLKFRTGIKGLIVYTGTANGTIGFTGTALGGITFLEYDGTADGTIGFTGTASGSVTFIELEGTANGDISFTGTAIGDFKQYTDGTADGTISFTGTANGEITQVFYEGTANGSISFTGTSTGSITEENPTGTANGTIGFTGTASGSFTYNSWSYIGTSGTQDGTVDFGISLDKCYSTTELTQLLDDNYPASDYAVDFIMRTLNTFKDSQTQLEIPCDERFFKVIEVTE